MRHAVSEVVVIALPLARVWERLRDLTQPHLYVSGLRRTQMDSENLTGVGASRTVFPKRLAPLQETVIEWTEGRGFVLRLHRGEKPMAPFREVSFGYAIEPVDEGHTCFTASMRYELGGGLLGSLLEAAVLRRVLQANVRDVAVKLKQFYETGQPTNPDRAEAGGTTRQNFKSP